MSTPQWITRLSITPWNPRQGWKRASLSRKLFALSVPVIIMSYVIMINAPMISYKIPDPIEFGFWYIYSSWAFYCAARVLRPHVRKVAAKDVRAKIDALRIRHGMSSVAMSLATPVLLALFVVNANSGIGEKYGTPAHDSLTAYWYIFGGLPALVLGAVTVVWGLLSIIINVSTPQPTSSQRKL